MRFSYSDPEYSRLKCSLISSKLNPKRGNLSLQISNSDLAPLPLRKPDSSQTQLLQGAKEVPMAFYPQSKGVSQ